MGMTKEQVLENIKNLEGVTFNKPCFVDEIICAFGDFEEDDETGVIITDAGVDNCDYLAYIDALNSTEFALKVDKVDNDGVLELTITDAWIC